jgi:hypothetical protein
MKLLNINESGANNILMWAITNGADIKSDPALQSVINDELSYIATLKDVNFFELFRLTQIYRDKVRIIDEMKAEMPSMDELKELFNGVYNPEPENPESTPVHLADIVEYCGNMFINLAMQMSTDNDIITPSAVRMFLPMISRKFTIQIPITFADIIDSMNSDEANEIYNTGYPSTLQTIIESETHGVKTRLQLAFLRATSIIKYDKSYEQYIKAIKYAPLKTCKNNKLYKISMLGFTKYDNISKSETRIDLFNINKDTMNNNLKRMSRIDTPLYLEFAIQLPIQYMQMLENFFSDEVLTIAYESSMSNIIDGGLIHEDFIISEYNEDTEDEIQRDNINKRNNAIGMYHIRINEANQKMLNSMPILLNSDGDIHVSSVFAMLPSMYATKAVIRISMDNLNKLLTHYDPIIKEMFTDATDIANSIIENISSYK